MNNKEIVKKILESDNVHSKSLNNISDTDKEKLKKKLEKALNSKDPHTSGQLLKDVVGSIEALLQIFMNLKN